MKYVITRGTFRVSPTKVLGVGDSIDLDDDVAARFADQLRLVNPPDAPVAVPVAAPVATEKAAK